MQKKYFKCYYCQTGNSYIVQKEQKGKKCRCCEAYNYFSNNKDYPKNSFYYNDYNYKNNNYKNNYKNKYYKNKNYYKKKIIDIKNLI